MNELEKEYEEIKNLILKCPLQPGSTGYVISAKFLTDFEESVKMSLPPDKIDNKNLFLPRSKKLKPSLNLNKDYYVVNESVWNQLCSDYGSVQPIKCPILQNGQGELYPIRFYVKYRNEVREISVSRGTELDELYVRVMVAFEINPNNPFEIYIHGQSEPIPIRGFVGDLDSSMTMLDVIPITDKIKQTNTNSKSHNESKSTIKLPPGIKNIGNSCYISASIQCFRFLPHFQSSLSSLNSNETKSKHPTSLTQVFLPLVRPSQKRFLDPTEFKLELSKVAPILCGTGQQDVQEFVSFLLDILQEEDPNSIINDLFFGEFESLTNCINCKSVNKIHEKFSTLSLPISAARRIIFYPWDLSKPMERFFTFPSSPCVILGRTRDGFRLSSHFEPDFAEALALQLDPSKYASNPSAIRNENACTEHITDNKVTNAVVIVKTTRGRLLTVLLVEVKANIDIFENALRPFIWDRLKLLWEPQNRKNIERQWKFVNHPSTFKFTPHPEYNCAEQILNISIFDSLATSQKGFKEIRMQSGSTHVTMNELLNAFFMPTQLDDDNSWICEQCHKANCAIKLTTLHKPPKCLIIQLKRFSITSMGETVDASPVEIPLTLDLSSFLTSPGNANYQLIGVVDHTGTLVSGHYTSTVTDGEKWFYFNDSHSELSEPPSGDSSSAYLLFYSQML